MCQNQEDFRTSQMEEEAKKNGSSSNNMSTTANGDSLRLGCDDEDDGYYFLSSDARREIPNYKYDGEDQSLLYIYLLAPVATYLVKNCTPSCIAPNTITLTGLVFMVVSYSILWYYYYSSSFDRLLDEPRWAFFFHGCAMLIYQTLDNMDGRQARKTNSSSPLGLLFDHGCDAINSLFGSVCWIIGLGLNFRDDPVHCTWIILGPMVLFYIATWEEYYTGKLVLPFINGPSDGLFYGAILSFVTCFYGTEFWMSTSLYDNYLSTWLQLSSPLRNADLQVLAAVIGMINEALFDKSQRIVRQYGFKTLRTQIPIWTLVVLTTLMIQSDTTKSLWQRATRTSLHIVSGLFVEIVSQLMLDHISHQTFLYKNMTKLFLLFLPPAIIITAIKDEETAANALLVYCTALWSFLIFKITLVVQEMCRLLGINCFDIMTPNKKNNRKKIA
mmetsp:Transcript_2181/g.2655  ORF Transcript_2181/g.2655 Transcript_2181/m.2655 type:complete len:443 (-) Transcript_2181:334-1662(-)